MPRLPVVSGKQVIKALEYLGYEKKRQRGSHVVMRKGDKGCVVPLHKALKAGTLAGIIRQSGLTVEELLEAL